MKLSIILPVRNEAKGISKTLDLICAGIDQIDYEIIAVNDFSDDDTYDIISKKKDSISKIKLFDNAKKGLGGAINLGIEKSNGDAICIMMADLSDDINDLKKYYELIQSKNVDAIFGSRFIKGSNVSDYPIKKLFLNRIFNYITKFIFLSDYNDFTNAFKIYKKNSLIKAMPLISEDFNIFLEIPLKIISRKMNYKIIPIGWKNRKEGKAKFNMKELRSKYLFTLIYCFLEKILLKKK
jgi:dolichol-phosphate mannosyltransferase